MKQATPCWPSQRTQTPRTQRVLRIWNGSLTHEFIVCDKIPRILFMRKFWHNGKPRHAQSEATDVLASAHRLSCHGWVNFHQAFRYPPKILPERRAHPRLRSQGTTGSSRKSPGTAWRSVLGFSVPLPRAFNHLIS